MKRSMGMMATSAIVMLTGALVFMAPSVYAVCIPATGQTTAYPAQNNGDVTPVAVPDDGTLQRGATLKYEVRKDGTVKDANTTLIWEVKCLGVGCPALHDVNNAYPWSGNGTTDTIWDWLAAINAEGGKGYAGHNDWRIPNVRELQSIVDYEGLSPAIDPIFGPTAVSDSYWSSTTFAPTPSNAWLVLFDNGGIFDLDKSFARFVRAVRGGPK